MATGVLRRSAGPLRVELPQRRLPFRVIAPVLLFALAWWAPVTPGAQAEWRTALLLVTAVVGWALDIAPDFVIALGFAGADVVTHLGPIAVLASGVASPTWLLAAAFLVTAAALRDSTVLERIAVRVLLALPHGFGVSTIVLLLGGLVLTPLVPSNIGRCAVMAPLAVAVARASGYADRSRASAGLGVAAFAGAALLSRGFLTGAVTNTVGQALLPPDARLGWGWWALAAAPTTLTILLGLGLAIVIGFRRHHAPTRLSPAALTERLTALGPLRVANAASAGASLLVLVALMFGTCFQISWAYGSGNGLVLGAALVAIGRRRLLGQLPLLVFLGVILGLPAVIRHAGIEVRLMQAIRAAVDGAPQGTALAITSLFVITVLVRFVLSEWVAVPVLTLTFVPAAETFSLHPWVIAFVVLLGSNLWLLPYQFTCYVTFVGASERRLFTHAQVRGVSVAFLVLSLLGLLVSIPFWRALGLVR